MLYSHRLSTITNADQILVLHAGKVAESGTHQDLLLLKGRYYNMWRKQIRAERAADKAFQAVAKAKALQEAAMDRPGSSGNEGSPSEDVSENEADNRSSTTLVTPSLASKALVHAAESLRDRDAGSSIDGSSFSDDKQDDVKSEHSTRDEADPSYGKVGQEESETGPSKPNDQPKDP